MGERGRSAQLRRIPQWGLIAVVLAGAVVLMTSPASMPHRFLPFLVIDLFVVFPVVCVVATHLVSPAPTLPDSRRTRLKGVVPLTAEPVTAGASAGARATRG